MSASCKLWLRVVGLIWSASICYTRRLFESRYPDEISRNPTNIPDAMRHPRFALGSLLFSFSHSFFRCPDRLLTIPSTARRQHPFHKDRSKLAVKMAADVYNKVDPYKTLGVSRTATVAEIKRAYRKMALRSHPDVNNSPNAEEEFGRIKYSYELLSDEKKRRQYDFMSGSGTSSTASRTSSSSRSGWDPSDPMGWASDSNDPAVEERRRRWREENPRPDELNDSFGSLFSDAASAIFNAVSGRGDWMSLLEDLLVTDGADLESLLRSSDLSMLQEELENAKWVQGALDKRIRRLSAELSDNEADLKSLRSDSDINTGAGARGMSQVYKRELEKDVRRSREGLRNAKNLLVQARTREQRIDARISELRSGVGRSAYRSGRSSNENTRSSTVRSLPSVDEEMARLKKKMGK